MRRFIGYLTLLLAFALGGAMAMLHPTSADVRTIHAAWGMDLADPSTVAGFADFIVVGEVVASMADEDESYTRHEVRVSEWLKGRTPKVIHVSQLGFVDEEGAIAQTEHQPLLRSGDTYVLALAAPVDGVRSALDLIGGPLSGTAADGQAARDLRGAGTGHWPTELVEDSRVRAVDNAAQWSSKRDGYLPGQAVGRPG